MTTQADSKSPVAEPAQEKSFITDEFLQEVDKNPEKIQDLTFEQQEEFHNYLMNDAEGEPSPVPEPTPEPPKEDPAPEPKPEEPETDPEPTPEQKDDKPAESELKEPVKTVVKKEKAEYQKLADEVNKYRQKKNSLIKALEKEKAQYEEIKKKKFEVSDDDIYDQEKMKSTMVELQELKEEVKLLRQNQASGTQAEIDAAAKLEQELQQRRVFSEIDDLQNSFPDLKTSVPFQKLDKKYGEFLDTLVTLSGVKVEDLSITDEQKANPAAVNTALRSHAYNVYQGNPEFKERADKHMPEVLKDKTNMANYSRILELNEQKKRNGGNLKMNFLHDLDESGKLEKYVNDIKKNTAIDASNKAAEAIENNSPTPLTPTDGPAESPSGEGLTMATAKQRVDALQAKISDGGVWTDAEQAEMQQVIMFLESQKPE